MPSRRFVTFGAVVGVVGLTGGAWFAGRQVPSPAEAAATANPPSPSRLTAPVEKRVLESTVITRGTVRYGDPRDVVLASSSLKNGATALPPSQIVSVPAIKGALLDEGVRALEVGGRPVLVLKGTNPAYRDLRPGDEGVDVRQLEDALQRLGFSPGAVDGHYDNATQQAVSAWYRKLGYDAFGPTESQQTAINAARDTLGRAEDGVLSATRALTQARAGVSADKLAAADERVRLAHARVQTATDDAERTAHANQAAIDAKTALLGLAQSQLAVDDTALARTQRDAANTTAVNDANNAFADAEASAREADANLEEAKAGAANAGAAATEAQTSLDATRVDLERAKRPRAVVLEPGAVIPDFVDAIRAAEATVRGAEATVRNAIAASESAQRIIGTRERAVVAANRQVDRARTALDRATKNAENPSLQIADLQQKSLTSKAEVTRLDRELQQARDTATTGEAQSQETLRAAEANVKIAIAERVQLGNDADERGARAQVSQANQARTRAAAELAVLESKAGIVIPANEVLFFDDVPVRVDEVKALRGANVTGPVMTVTTSKLAVDSSVDTSDAKLMKVGAKVTIESNEFNVTLPGTVTEVATSPGTKGVDPTKVYIAVTPEASTQVNASDLNGASVKLTIPIRSTGTEVLAVPESAVSVGPDGSARVEVETTPGGPTRFVTVRTGVAAAGYIAITPVGGSLKVGDNVTTGDASPTTIEGKAGPEDASSDTKPPSAPNGTSNTPDSTPTTDSTAKATATATAASSPGSTS